MPQTPLGIDYTIGTDEYAERYVRDANQIECLLNVAWDDVADWKREVLGYSERDPGATMLRRTLPLLCPLTAAMRLATLTLVKFGSDGTPQGTYDRTLEIDTETRFAVNAFPLDTDLGEDPATNGWWKSEKAVYKAVFTRPPWKYSLEDAEATSSSIRELSRYCYWQDNWNARERRRPDFGFETDEATPVVAPIVGFDPDLEIEYTCTWFQIPIEAIPRTTIEANLTKVNSVALDTGDGRTFAVGTLLFKGVRGLDQVYEAAGGAGELFVDLKYVFGWRKNGWNKFKKTDGTFVDVKARNVGGAVRPYQTADLKSLWVPA